MEILLLFLLIILCVFILMKKNTDAADTGDTEDTNGDTGDTNGDTGDTNGDPSNQTTDKSPLEHALGAEAGELGSGRADCPDDPDFWDETRDAFLEEGCSGQRADEKFGSDSINMGNGMGILEYGQRVMGTPNVGGVGKSLGSGASAVSKVDTALDIASVGAIFGLF